jgi:hypothetical protein
VTNHSNNLTFSAAFSFGKYVSFAHGSDLKGSFMGSMYVSMEHPLPVYNPIITYVEFRFNQISSITE